MLLLGIVLPFSYNLVAMVIAYVVVCLLVGLGGLDRNIGFWGHFLIALVMSPLVGVVVLCTSERRQAPRELDDST